MKTDRLKTSKAFQHCAEAVIRDRKSDVALAEYMKALKNMRQRAYARTWKSENKDILYDRPCVLQTLRQIHPEGSPGRILSEFILSCRYIRKIDDRLIRKLIRYDNAATSPPDTPDTTREMSPFIDLDEEDGRATTPRPDLDVDEALRSTVLNMHFEEPEPTRLKSSSPLDHTLESTQSIAQQ